MKRAIITGADGQDGSYLSEILLDKNYEVIGVIRPGTHPPKNLTKEVLANPNFTLLKADVTQLNLLVMFGNMNADEFYHLAALSHVGDSFKHPTLTHVTNFFSTQRLLSELLKHPKTRFYFAGSSETFAEDATVDKPANPLTPYSARSPYAVSKAASQMLVEVYRNAYNVYAVNGIAFNHESRRRGPNFVTRKLALGVRGYVETGVPVRMGNFLARRDWHHAHDTMMGAWLSLQQSDPYDYVFASGVTRSVYEFAEAVCEYFGVETDEAVVWDHNVERRPWDVDCLCGDPTRAEEDLGWKRIYSFDKLVEDVCNG